MIPTTKAISDNFTYCSIYTWEKYLIVSLWLQTYCFANVVFYGWLEFKGFTRKGKLITNRVEIQLLSNSIYIESNMSMDRSFNFDQDDK